MTTKTTRKSSKTSKTPVTPEAIVATDTATQIEPIADAAPAPELPVDVPAEPTFDLDAAVRVLHATQPLAPEFRVPASYAALVATLRSVVPDLDAVTGKDRDDAFYRRVVRAIETRMREALPDAPEPATIHTSRWLGLGVQDAQDVVYHACAASGMFVPADIVCCVWRALLPKAKCDYLGRGIAKGYATTTLSGYMRGDHGTNPWFPGAVEALRPWYVAGGVTNAPKAK